MHDKGTSRWNEGENHSQALPSEQDQCSSTAAVFAQDLRTLGNSALSGSALTIATLVVDGGLLGSDGESNGNVGVGVHCRRDCQKVQFLAMVDMQTFVQYLYSETSVSAYSRPPLHSHAVKYSGPAKRRQRAAETKDSLLAILLKTAGEAK